MIVLSNLATSLDGKIATASRVLFPLGTPLDRKIMKDLRAGCDAVVVGASTLRTFKGPLLTGKNGKQPLNVIVSRTLEGISPEWAFFTNSKVRRLLLVTGKVSNSRLRVFAGTSVVAQLSALRPLAPQIIATLKKLGVKKLVVEGGGALMWDFVSLDLIDEYFVTITPRLLGGTDAPTLVDGPGFSPSEVVNLKLTQCQKVGNELYLHYKKTGRRGI